MKKLSAILTLIVLGFTLQATESTELTVPEKARTASFVFKANLVLGCKEPFGMHPGCIPNEYEAFLKIWMNEDVTGLGESDIAKTQKKKMAAFVEDLHFVFTRELVNPKWEGKSIDQIADNQQSSLRHGLSQML